ncbi:50S ribosomal protein L30P [Marine Group I thaumarchaeote SCGC AAA799-B03]|uniref:Large ribosomal subunit protein uL30 n=5 Tax=Marine Group I TaxID=905826 RepID=A0A087S7Y8_9ARCH|nr:50S ribosomal protein L30P [Marine Group I thaumarchaeote SCGC AAA799-N04]KFM17027.1 50S ribosomal protein L30P [Marine Group I thaumarchaeote SCGC AAA799-D11]KFM19128.1 50S ribosomal protein L30P [Marine Group I thaumarchaeote SCGC RSA3]KFM21842.1 50S ribosomal protein L30P [Marine Group I thaumarchaeote SCGC AAA799-B03]
MANAVLVVRIKGQADCPYWASTTMDLLKLERKYRAVILPAKDNLLGMLKKVQHYVSWVDLDADLAKELIDKKARKAGYKKVTEEDLKELGYASSAELAAALTEGKTMLSKLKPLKPWFALAPPRHGFKRSTKKLYGQKGILGRNKELGTIVRNMI